MKIQVVKRAGKWTVGAALLGGLAYSALTLTLTATPAYASSCDCTAEHEAAEIICAERNDILVSFDCFEYAWIGKCGNTGPIGGECTD
jgi:hypothetical protein